MLKVSFGVLAALVLLYLGFYVLPGTLWATDTLDAKQQCEAELLDMVDRAQAGQTGQSEPQVCAQLRARGQAIEAVAR